MRRAIKIIWKTVKLVFIVFALYVGSLFFREERLPRAWVERLADGVTPSNIVFHVDSVAFGFRHGLHVRGFKLYDRDQNNPLTPVVSAESISVYWLARSIRIEGLKYPRLPDSYYQPVNKEVTRTMAEVKLPAIEKFALTLINPNILGIAPRRVVADVEIADNRLVVDRIKLDWPDQDEHIGVDGFCYVDIARHEIYGECGGKAKQVHIRPLLVTLECPSAMPYFDGFTEVAGAVPSWCSWRVNLINNDFDLGLKLNPELGRYNGVNLKSAEGNIHLHVYTRGNWLNYHQTIGPIKGIGPKNESLNGTIVVDGTNGYNTVTVNAESALPIADLLKIGGFTGDYVGNDVFGESKCQLEFRFPRAMTNNYEMLNGKGHVEVKNGLLMRMKGFQGLLAQLADRVPGISWFTDSTQASGDYVIENGVVKSNNMVIEGSVFSIKLMGEFDAVHNQLDYKVMVQFAKSDSLAGKLLHPLTWPFTKLLMEFRLTGTPSKPEWKYISVIDRVMEVAR